MGWPVTENSSIYAIRCKVNDRVYIGRTSSIERRVKEHFTELRKGKKTYTENGSKVCIKSLIQEDYDKFGEGEFEVYILEENISPEKCKEREAYWIAEYNSADADFGYNKMNEQGRPEMPFAKHGLPPNKFKKSK